MTDGGDNLYDVAAAIGEAVALLAEHENPLVAEIGEWVRSDGKLFAHLAATENQPGRSLARKYACRVRNAALREAALLGSYAAAELAVELHSYFTTSWPREKSQAENPHPPGSVRACLWTALRAHGHCLGERQIERILGGDE